MATLPDRGIINALWTPTDADGHILEPALVANLHFLRRHGVHGLMVLGSTGEFVRLEVAVRQRLLELVRQHATDLPSMANISDMRPAVVAQLGRAARELEYEAVALLPPWYFPVPQPDLVEFFVRAGENAGLPLVLYNFPERTGNRLALETVAAVADRVPVAGIKQSGSEFSYHRDLAALGREKHFVVLTGADCQLAEAMAMGVSGCVGGLANVVPEVMVSLYNAVLTRADGTVARLTERMEALGRLVDTLEFPLNVAAAMQARGLEVGEMKFPMSPTTAARQRHLTASLQGLFRDWNLN